MTRQELRIKRVYQPPDAGDGVRVLVDRLWPRGLSRERAQIDLWLKEISPSDGLRRRYHGDPTAWEDFKTAYYTELEQPPAQSGVRDLLDRLRRAPVTLLFAPRRDPQQRGRPTGVVGRAGRMTCPPGPPTKRTTGRYRSPSCRRTARSRQWIWPRRCPR